MNDRDQDALRIAQAAFDAWGQFATVVEGVIQAQVAEQEKSAAKWIEMGREQERERLAQTDAYAEGYRIGHAQGMLEQKVKPCGHETGEESE